MLFWGSWHHIWRHFWRGLPNSRVAKTLIIFHLLFQDFRNKSFNLKSFNLLRREDRSKIIQKLGGIFFQNEMNDRENVCVWERVCVLVCVCGCVCGRERERSTKKSILEKSFFPWKKIFSFSFNFANYGSNLSGCCRELWWQQGSVYVRESQSSYKLQLIIGDSFVYLNVGR